MVTTHDYWYHSVVYTGVCHGHGVVSWSRSRLGVVGLERGESLEDPIAQSGVVVDEDPELRDAAAFKEHARDLARKRAMPRIDELVQPLAQVLLRLRLENS